MVPSVQGWAEVSKTARLEVEAHVLDQPQAEGPLAALRKVPGEEGRVQAGLAQDRLRDREEAGLEVREDHPQLGFRHAGLVLVEEGV